MLNSSKSVNRTFILLRKGMVVGDEDGAALVVERIVRRMVMRAVGSFILDAIVCEDWVRYAEFGISWG